MIAPEDSYLEKCCVDRDRLKTACETSKKIRTNPAAGPAGSAIDRRARSRYPLSMTFTYRALRSGKEGAGRTLNMSSKGLCCSGLRSLPTGTRLKLWLDWPVLLEGVCRLQMLILGRVLRNDTGQSAVVIEHYEFHTRGTGTGRRGISQMLPLKKLTRGPSGLIGYAPHLLYNMWATW
jgi:hypothetical protein